MGEAGVQLPQDLEHENEAEKEEVIMATLSPDRPPGENLQKSGELHSDEKPQQEQHQQQEPEQEQQQQQQLSSTEAETPNSNSNSNANFSRAPEKPELKPGGRRSRWDHPTPAPEDAGASFPSSDHPGDNSFNSTTTTTNNNNNSKHRRSFGNYSDWDDDPRSRRYNNNSFDKQQRCMNYYRNDPSPPPPPPPPYIGDSSGAYPRPGSGSGFYDRGAIRFTGGSRNGFERRGDWCPRRDRREWSRESFDRRSEWSERREWHRGERRRSEEWHPEFHHRSNQWHASDATRAAVSMSFGSPGFQTGEALAYHSPVALEAGEPLPEKQAEEPEKPQAEVGEPGEVAEDGYEPGEVKASKGWVYINDHGDMQGPMELAALKLLASNGFMQQDHLVSRVGTNAWITLEHAKSPDLDSAAYSKLTKPAVPAREKPASEPPQKPPQRVSEKESGACFDLDARVEKILTSYQAGSELKSGVLAALDARRHSLAEDGCSPMTLYDPWKDTAYDLGLGVDADLEHLRANVSKPAVEEPPAPAPPAPPAADVMRSYEMASPLKWVPGRWTSKGGDWKLLHPEGHNYVKVVLNEGSLLLSQLKHQGGDPRKHLHLPEPGSRRVFELPHWAAQRNQKASEANAESSSRSNSKPASKSSKPGVKPPGKVENGRELVDKNSSSKKLEPRGRGGEKPATSGVTLVEKHQHPKTPISTPPPPPLPPPPPPARFADIKAKSPHDLARGDWFYKNGAGLEKGPYSFSELQGMVSKELLTPGTSVYRRSDDLWVPVPHPEVNDGSFSVTEVSTSSFDSTRRVRKVITTSNQQIIMGFTSGQLHEHVMKHYKNQVMSAILFEGLDSRIKMIESTKKLSEVAILSSEDLSVGLGKGPQSPSSSHDTSDEREEGEHEHRYHKRAFRAFRVNGNHEQISKKRRLIYCDEDEYESSDDELPPPKAPKPRLVYCDDFDSSDDETPRQEEAGAWESLGLSTLMRVCHHLRGDFKSLAFLSMTCSSWRVAVQRFKPKVKCLDLSSIGARCQDSVFSSVQEYGELTQLSLKDCVALSSQALGSFLSKLPSVRDVDITGCEQFSEMIHSFPRVNWICDDESEGSDSITQLSDGSQRKMKSLKSIGGTSESKEEEDVDESEPMDIDACYTNEQDFESMTQYSGTKRVKLSTKKENGYVKLKKTSTEKQQRVSKKLGKLGSLRRPAKTPGLEEDTASTLNEFGDAGDALSREWGARMTKAAMVPPVTRKYEVIDEYCVVIDREQVERKMRVELPDDYEEKLRASKQKRGGEYSHLDIPELKDYQPRRQLGVEVLEQEVYGIDPYTHNLLLDTMPKLPALSPAEKIQFMEENLLQAINKEVNQFTASGKAPIEYSLEPVIQRMIDEACDETMKQFCQNLLSNLRLRSKEKYVVYRKGLGVVCNKEGGFKVDDFVVEFLGEVYPAWRWYEKQDGCRYLQKKDKDPAPEFYNILLERPKGDAAGYDLVVVDAMHKANFASRICHSCKPNCEAKVTAVNNRYIIGVYALRPIQNGEELTFDYNSVTESKEEYNNSICLCGSQCCRGSYLNLANAGASQEIIKEYHGLLDRHALLLEACCDGPVTRHELEEMRQAGVGACLLDGLPDWLLKYTARLVEFMNMERQRLPDELLKTVKKRKKDDFAYEWGRVDAENHAEGVYNQRLQNIAITLDKVRYVLRQLFTEPREAPPLLKKLEQKELVSRLWSADNSIVHDLLNSMKPHIPPEKLAELKRQVREHTPDENVSLRESLLWLRDTLRSLEPTVLSRHDAAADLVHMYAYTQCFFTCEEYGTFESPAIEISALDLGRHVNSSATYTWKKTYNKEYVLGQLIWWFKQSAADPGASLVAARRGCLVLPDFSSCYAKGLQQDSRRAYGSRIREEMFPRMERWPQKQWPKSQFWEFKSNRGLFGSPMLDAVQRGGHPDVEMMHWLKTRSVNFVGPYDD